MAEKDTAKRRWSANKSVWIKKLRVFDVEWQQMDGRLREHSIRLVKSASRDEGAPRMDLTMYEVLCFAERITTMNEKEGLARKGEQLLKDGVRLGMTDGPLRHIYWQLRYLAGISLELKRRARQALGFDMGDDWPLYTAPPLEELYETVESAESVDIVDKFNE